MFALPVNSALNPFLYTLSAIAGSKVIDDNITLTLDWFQSLVIPRHTKYAEGVYSIRRFRPSVCPSFRPSVNTQVLFRSYLITYISAATYQKLFIFGLGVPGRVFFHSTSMDP